MKCCQNCKVKIPVACDYLSCSICNTEFCSACFTVICADLGKLSKYETLCCYFCISGLEYSDSAEEHSEEDSF